MTAIDVDDLAMLATGFEAAMRDAPDPASTTAALVDLGWIELLAASPAQAVATAFGALGTTGSVAGLVDDVVAHALGIAPDAGTAVALPAPARSAPPGTRDGGRIVVDGMASARLHHAATVFVPVAAVDGVEVLAVDADRVRTEASPALDTDQALVRLRATVDIADATPVDIQGAWPAAVASGRVALAHQLVGASRTMLDQARQHAVDRVQFGRAVSSFQAVRHKLAESLVAIEGAAAVVDAVGDEVDPLLAALAKSLAGQAARTTSAHAQQVLAGIGFTTDHPFHRWMKRAAVLDVALGSAASLPAEIGAELLRRRSAPRLVEL